MKCTVWELPDSDRHPFRLIEEMEADDLVDAAKAARDKFAGRGMRVYGDGFSIELPANGGPITPSQEEQLRLALFA